MSEEKENCPVQMGLLQPGVSASGSFTFLRVQTYSVGVVVSKFLPLFFQPQIRVRDDTCSTVSSPVQQYQPPSGTHCIYRGGSSECPALGHHCMGQNSQPGQQRVRQQFSDDIIMVFLIFSDV